MTGRPGFSLLELIVAIAVLAVVGSIAGLAWVGTDWSTAGGRIEPAHAAIQEARRSSVAGGRPVTIRIESPAGGYWITALPDGRLLGGHAAGLDPLTGRLP